MKILTSNLYIYVATGLLLFTGSCKEDSLNSEPAIINSFTVKGKDGTVFRSTINDDNTITVKVSPYLDAEKMLDSATSIFYLSKGATVSPNPSIPQNFAQDGGVKYTVTGQDGISKKVYTASWGTSDQLPDGAGFSYAEIGTEKNFSQLGYPGEYNNFNLPDTKQYGELNMYTAYCGEYIILLSRAYIDSDTNSPQGIKVVNKNTLTDAGKLNLGTISPLNLKTITSDYKGHAVGLVIENNTSEFFYWKTPSDLPTSIGKININMASPTDGSANFQVAGDITANAWITALAPRGNTGDHYRIQVNTGQLANTFTTISTGYSSSDCSGFQMIAPINDSDKPNFIVGDTQGTSNTANSNKIYINSFAGSTITVIPALWQNILQNWWSGTGFSTERYGGRSPVVSALVINGKSYAFVTSGTSWWNAAAVLSSDLQSLAHENLNIATSINRSWSYGAWGTWYYNEDKKEAYLAVWFERDGLKTYKLTCFE